MSENVLLGFTDAKITKKDLQYLNNESNYLGYNERSIDSRDTFLLCSKCIAQKTDTILHFLLQIYCPVDEDFHRTLLVYQCSKCGNFDIFRTMKRYSEEPQEIGDKGDGDKKTDLFGEQDDWGGKEDDWGASGGDLDPFDENEVDTVDDWGNSGENQCSSSKTELFSKRLDPYHYDPNSQILKSKIPIKNRFREFTPFYVSVETEAVIYGKGVLCLDDDDDEDQMGSSYSSNYSQTSKSTSVSQIIPQTLNSDQEMETLTVNLGKLGNETTPETESATSNYNNMTKGGVEQYEKLSVQHGDLSFYKFSEYLKKCPEQILRYSCKRSLNAAIPFNNKAMVLLENAKKHRPKCKYCGSETKFEMQLLPRLQDELLEDDVRCKQNRVLEDNLPDFGSVYIFTCVKSCWNEDENDDQLRLEVEPLVVVDTLR